MTFRLIEADCVEAMRDMDESSVDAIVTDPPYGLHFMGKTWDKFGGPSGADNTTHSKRGGAMHAGTYDLRLEGQRGFQAEAFRWAEQMLRVLKPGGHLLIFGGTRTYHRLACAIEDAGFEIRDTLAWMYGSGFPKSLDVSKAIDKAAGAARDDVYEDVEPVMDNTVCKGLGVGVVERRPATPEAQRWQGWGTALKPAYEPVVLARKPLSERNVAANVQRWGVGAINVDGCRIEGEVPKVTQGPSTSRSSWDIRTELTESNPHPAGRWPANVTLGHSPECEPTNEVRKVKAGTWGAAQLTEPGNGGTMGEGWTNTPSRDPGVADADGMESVRVWKCAPGCAVAMLDEQTGEDLQGRVGMTQHGSGTNGVYGKFARTQQSFVSDGTPDTGGASRFFYVAKADSAERNRGLEHMPEMPAPNAVGDPDNPTRTRGSLSKPRANHHPTVKPVALMQWLVRMVTPPGGTVLDPFTGSGSTGIAALREGVEFIGIEREPEYVEIARARIIGDAPLFNEEVV